jgi:hypothetical protein
MTGYGMLSIFMLLIGAMIPGYLLEGPGKDTRNLPVLGNGQRNISAAILVCPPRRFKSRHPAMAHGKTGHSTPANVPGGLYISRMPLNITVCGRSGIPEFIHCDLYHAG